MLIAVFVGLFYLTVDTTSLREASLIWGSAILLSAIIVGGVCLVIGD